MTFREKIWERNGNHYNLIGSKVRVYFWNSGKNQTYAVEVIGIGLNEQNFWNIHGKGPEARDEAINTAIALAMKYNNI